MSLDEAKAAAEKLIPILVTNAGADVVALDRASIITTSSEDLA